MILLTLAAAIVLVAATATVVRAIVRDRREIRRWQAERADTEALIAYHARRSQEIARALDELGDRAEYLFPPARNHDR